MIIQDQTFEIKWHGMTQDYYMKLGYPKLKIHEKFVVPLSDLKPTSSCLVKCICDKCKKNFSYEYYKIIKYGGSFCPQCRMKMRFKEHYGKIENPDNNKLLSKMKNKTHFDRTGYTSVSADPNVQRARSDTYEKKTGYRNPFSNPSVIEKIKNKNLIRYKKNNMIPTSRYQLHLHHLLVGSEINYIFEQTAIDIAFPDKMIGIEYNGSGHFYSVLIGKESPQDALIKDLKRSYFLKQHGWKLILIDHLAEKKQHYDDHRIIFLINLCIKYLLATSHKWIRIDIDDNIVYGESLLLLLDNDGNIVKELK